MGSWDSYLQPPDYGEGELETTETVSCQQELCNEFDKEVEWTGTAYAYGSGYSTFTVVVQYTCPECGLVSEHSWDRDNEYYADPDEWGDRLRDEG